MEYNAGDETEVKGRKTKAQLRREQEVEEMKQLLATKFGRNVLWRILSQCGVYKLSFTGNSTTFFNEGRRDVGNYIIGEISAADNKAYPLMMLEAIDIENN